MFCTVVIKMYFLAKNVEKGIDFTKVLIAQIFFTIRKIYIIKTGKFVA